MKVSNDLYDKLKDVKQKQIAKTCGMTLRQMLIMSERRD